MKPRSLILNLFGDYVRYYGGEISFQNLAGLVALFDVSEETARVTCARIKRKGWLDSRRVGRRSWYALTALGWRLLDEGRERIFWRRADDDWDGTWYMIIYSVPEAERPAREQLRKTLQWLGFGALASSTWVSPHDRLNELAAVMSDRGITAHSDAFRAQTGCLERDRELAARCWDLERIHAAYEAFVRAHRHDAAAGSLGDRASFVERIRLVHDYRKFPFIDPDLPPALLPQDWAGTAAHAVFLEAYETLREPAFRYFERILEPPPEGSHAPHR